VSNYVSEPGKVIERIIQEFVPGKQVTLAHRISHPAPDLSAKIGVPGAKSIGILTLTPGEDGHGGR